MDADFEIVEKLEYEISSKEIRSDSSRLSTLIHNDFEEFGKSGKRFSKSDIVNEVPTWDYHEIEIKHLECVRLSVKTVLVKYQSFSNGVRANRSSIWVKENSHWQMIFHQGTIC